MSTEKKAPDGVNTLTIDDDGGVTSTLMHVPNKMSTEKDREKKELNMRAYYYRFKPTGVIEIDKVLSAVADAGSSYHHTDCWSDKYDYGSREGKSEIDLIQEAANECAKAIQHARQGERERLKKAMIKAYLKGVNDCPDDKYFGHLPCEKDAEELFDDYEIDEFLEQESKI